MLEVFSDDGRFTAASAIAATFDNGKQLLIGTVFRDLTHCDIDVPLDFWLYWMFKWIGGELIDDYRVAKQKNNKLKEDSINDS